MTGKSSYKKWIVPESSYDRAWGKVKSWAAATSTNMEMMMYKDFSAHNFCFVLVFIAVVCTNKQTQSGSLPLMCNYFSLHAAVYFHSIQITQQMLMSANPHLWLSHCLMLQFSISKNISIENYVYIYSEQLYFHLQFTF